jgi:hypothetical protein
MSKNEILALAKQALCGISDVVRHPLGKTGFEDGSLIHYQAELKKWIKNAVEAKKQLESGVEPKFNAVAYKTAMERVGLTRLCLAEL